ncbi:MAG: type II secretion system protein M, partial [Pseudomonadota bacterium]|nr:type II secretion system protein M [Pseudomonadota bacterium]
MIAALRLWFDSRALREKRLLLVAAALVIVVLLWGGIALPVTDALATATARHADAVTALGQV